MITVTDRDYYPLPSQTKKEREMKLQDHFKKHLSSDFAAARAAITASVLDDPLALWELEDSRELWLGLPANTLSCALGQIFKLRQKDNSAAAFSVRQEQIHIGQAVEKLYMDAINAWLDAEFQQVDLNALIEAEHTPEDVA